VSATIARKVVTDLKEFGVVQRGLLGVGLRPIDAGFAKENDLKLEGVYVASVTESSAAAAAGIKEGDVITSINNVAVNTVPELQEQVSKFRPNDKVNVTVIRDKKTQQFSVTLRNIEGTTQILPGESSNSIFGTTFEDVSQKEKQDLGIKSGVKVKEVGQGKLREARIRNGFIITEVNDKPVSSVSDIRKIIDTVRPNGRIVFNGIYPNGQVGYYAVVK
jgi:S1-C subfamily serine protease